MLNSLRSVDPWSYVVMGLIALYIALVNPSNTPAFFSNPVFKFVLFAFVAIVCVLEGSCIGVLFAVAMALPVVYSSMREGYANPFLEAFGGYQPADSNENDDDSSSIEQFKNKTNKKNKASNSNNQEDEQKYNADINITQGDTQSERNLDANFTYTLDGGQKPDGGFKVFCNVSEMQNQLNQQNQ